MTKYFLEDGTSINFIKELNETLITEDNNETNTCLITGDILTENFVKMECGHSFNYLPLYKDIINHKTKYNLEINRLTANEIRCPYCRKSQKGVLPYYDIKDVKLIHGVNFIDETKIITNHIYGKCFYINKNFPDVKCFRKYVFDLNGKTYCYCHRNVILKEEFIKKKLEEKETLKKIKLEEKETLKKIKLQEKETLKQKKIQEKETLKQKKIQENINIEEEKNNLKNLLKEIDENIVVTNISFNCCIETLKTGLRKGQPCGKKIIENGIYCLRHYNLQNK